jgi:hypothetical protein
MQTYTESEQQNLSVLLEQAARDGEVRIQRADGTTFVLRPEETKPSALDVTGIDLNLSKQEIVEFVREGRERSNGLSP